MSELENTSYSDLYRICNVIDTLIKNIKKSGDNLGCIKCPECKDGKLYYTVASSNGHCHGQCSTKGCLSWME